MATTIDDLRKGLDLLYDRFADGDEAVAVLGLLGAAVAELSAARAEVARLTAALTPLAAPADEWHGWWLDEWGERPTGQTWRCFLCFAEGEEVNGSPPPHQDDCPIVVARVLLAGTRPPDGAHRAQAAPGGAEGE